MTGHTDIYGHLLRQLRETVEQAGNLLRSLEHQAPRPGPGLEGTEARQAFAVLQRELEEAKSDSREITSLMIEAERRSSRLMSLYVALHQLHATLDRQEVYSAIAEIAVDLLGADRFALLLQDEEHRGAKVALARGLEGDPPASVANGEYRPGDGQIEATLSDGQLRIGPLEGSDCLAIVPLRVEERVIGALVVWSVFAHKQGSLENDRDLLDLLSVHASSALLAAESYSATDRKLKTLKDLMSLLPKTS